MKRWEYFWHLVPVRDLEIKDLDRIGHDGWEMVSSTPVNGDEIIFMFKKQLVPTPKEPT